MSIEDEKSKRTAAPTKLQSRPKNGERKNSNGAAKTKHILSKHSAEIPHYMRPCTGSCHDACKREYQTASDAPGRAAPRIINSGSRQNVSKCGVKGKGGSAKSPIGLHSCPAKIGRSFGMPMAVPSVNSRKLRCEACKHRQQMSVEAAGSPRTPPPPPQRSVTVCSEPYSRRREDEYSANWEVNSEVKLSDANCEVKSEVEVKSKVKLPDTADPGEPELPALLAPGEIDSNADETKTEFKIDCISDEAKSEFKIDCASDETKRKFKREGRGDRHFGDENRESKSVVLKHRDIAGRKASEDWMVDHVVEKAVNNLARCEESKVKAVVGAFESVISYTVK